MFYNKIKVKLVFGFTMWPRKQAHASYLFVREYLTITPRAPMGSESLVHEAEGRMSYWLRGHEGETYSLVVA